MKILLTKILSLLSFFGFSQSIVKDTIQYNGFFNNCFLMESYTLYPDSTFKWTSEFDLSHDEYGTYILNDGIIQFDFYIDFMYPKSMSLKDSIAVVENSESRNLKSIRTEHLEIDGENLYYVSENGERAPTKRKAPCKRPLGWLFGNKYEYIIYRVKDEDID